MSLIFASILLWLVADNATAHHRSLPGKPDERCYLPGDMQAYPPTGCTNDVIYCGWDGDIANQHTFIWILHKNVCPSGEILNNVLKCIPGECGPQPSEPCPNDQLFNTVAYDVGNDCTPYFLMCTYYFHEDHSKEQIWWGYNCGISRFDEDSRRCDYGNFCPSVFKPDAEEGEQCDFTYDVQNHPDPECGPNVICCGCNNTRLWGYSHECESDEILDDLKNCVPIPEKCYK